MFVAMIEEELFVESSRVYLYGCVNYVVGMGGTSDFKLDYLTVSVAKIKEPEKARLVRLCITDDKN